jgi:hypothetical protein
MTVEVRMSWLGRVLHTLRVMTGFEDASESHLTPDHGWLLSTPAEARQQRADSAARRAAGEKGPLAP